MVWLVSLVRKMAWLHELFFLKPNWFLWVLLICGDFMSIIFSNNWARELEIEIGLILLMSVDNLSWLNILIIRSDESE